jgi:hypothetical protein
MSPNRVSGNRPKGYIWPVKKDWGLKVFKEISGHFDYGYDRPRLPKEGQVLVFYSDKQLLGSLPVDEDAHSVTGENLQGWKRRWKYVVGVDGAGKIQFDPPISIEEVADIFRVLRGKPQTKFHSICRAAPRLSTSEYSLLLSKTMPFFRSSSISRNLKTDEVPSWLEDLSKELKK